MTKLKFLLPLAGSCYGGIMKNKLECSKLEIRNKSKNLKFEIRNSNIETKNNNLLNVQMTKTFLILSFPTVFCHSRPDRESIQFVIPDLIGNLFPSILIIDSRFRGNDRERNVIPDLIGNPYNLSFPT